MGVNSVRATREKGHLTHSGSLVKGSRRMDGNLEVKTARVQRPSPEEPHQSPAWILHGYHGVNTVDSLSPRDVSGMERKENVTFERRKSCVSPEEPLGADHRLFLDPSATMGDDGRVRRGYHAAPTPCAHPEVPFLVPERPGHIHSVFARLFQLYPAGMEVSKPVRPTSHYPLHHRASVGARCNSKAHLNGRRKGRAHNQSRIKGIPDLKRSPRKDRCVQGESPGHIDYVGSPTAPGVTPDILNSALEGNHMAAILSKLNFKARIHAAELVDISDVGSVVKKVAIAIHKASHSRLDKGGGADDVYRAVGLVYTHRELPRRKTEWNQRRPRRASRT